MAEHPFGWLSLLPPVAAIALAILTGRVLVALVGGILLGAVVTAWDALTATVQELGFVGFLAVLPLWLVEVLELYFWAPLVDGGLLRVIAFTLMMGAMVGVLARSGGMTGLINVVSRFATNRYLGQLVVWFLGVLIFFDDYANTVLLGHTTRPLADRLRISREKLAYLVDSTSAPVAGLAIISTWVATELSYMADGLKGIPGEHSPMDLFVASIPYRFYVLLAIFFVFLVAVTGRDFGPMRAAERRARDAGLDGEADSSTPVVHDDTIEPPPGTPARWWNAILPVAVTLFVVLWLLYRTGLANLDPKDAASATMVQIFGSADSFVALVWGSLAGLATAVALAWGQRLLTGAEITEAAGRGARLMLPALAVLWLASALSAQTQGEPPPSLVIAPLVEPAVSEPIEDDPFPHRRYRLYSGEYLSSLLTPAQGAAAESQWWLLAMPTLVFVLASVIAFSTGTSWGTMGILMPITIPLVYRLLDASGSADPTSEGIFLASVGGVLAGAIFGDHCSPLSDTTVLSSQSCGCDHMAHVRTQLPYALVVAGVAIGLGTVPVALGISPWPLLAASAVVLGLVIVFVGRPLDTTGTTDPSRDESEKLTKSP